MVAPYSRCKSVINPPSGRHSGMMSHNLANIGRMRLKFVLQTPLGQSYHHPLGGRKQYFRTKSTITNFDKNSQTSKFK